MTSEHRFGRIHKLVSFLTSPDMTARAGLTAPSKGGLSITSVSTF